MENRIKTHRYTIPEGESVTTPIEVGMSFMSNSIMVAISQIGKFGSIIHGSCDNLESSLQSESNLYEVKTIFGSREYEIYEIVARKILDLMYDKEAFLASMTAKYGIHLDSLCEITNNIIKLIKQSSDVQQRTSLGRFLCVLIEEGVCSREPIRLEVSKYAIKFAQSDKSDALRLEGMLSLLAMIKKNVMNFEAMLTTSLKCISTGDVRLQGTVVEVLGQLFHIQVEMERTLLHQAVLKKQDKKLPVTALQALSTKEYVSKLFQNFSSTFDGSPALLLAWQHCLLLEVKNYGSVIVRGLYEVLLNYLQKPTGNSAVNCSSICRILLEKLSMPQMREILTYLLERIKNLKSNQVVAKLLLQGVGIIISTLGSSFLCDQRPHHFIDSLVGAISIGSIPQKPHSLMSPLSLSVLPDYLAIMRSFFLHNPQWQQNILSILLNITTVYTADLAVENQDTTAVLLRAHAIALGTLLPLVDVGTHSVPIELASQLWSTATAQVGQERNPFQKETGWMVLCLLLRVEFMCTMNRVKEVMQLVQEQLVGKVFANATELQQGLLGLGRIPELLYGVLTCSLTLNESMIKFISQIAIQFYQLLKPQKGVMECKYYLFRCLSLLPPKNYSSHLNSLVQLSVDDVLITGSPWVDVGEDALFVGDTPPHPRGIMKKERDTQTQHIQPLPQPQNEFDVALSSIDFFSYIMITKSFTLKNKVNLVGYLLANIQTIVASKETSTRPQRLLPYLVIVRAVQRKLLLHPDQVPQDAMFVQSLLACAEACSSIASRPLKMLVGQIVAQHVDIQSPYVDKQKILKQSQSQYILSQLLQNYTAGTTAYVTAELMRRESTNLHVQNLFVKMSSQMTSLYEDVLPMVQSVSMFDCIPLLRGTFMYQAFHSMGLSRCSGWALRMGTDILIQYFKTTRLDVNDPLHQNTYLHTLVGDTRWFCLQEQKRVPLALLNYYTRANAAPLVPLFQELQWTGDDSRWSLLPPMREALTQYEPLVVLLNWEMRRTTPGEFKKIFTRLLGNALKALTITQRVELLAPLVLEEFIITSATAKSSTTQLIQQQESTSVENHPAFRQLMMRRASKVINAYNPGQHTLEDVVSTANTIFSLLFKVTSLPIDALRNEAFVTLFKLFKRLRPINDALMPFVAQTDALVSETLRREDAPHTSVLNLKLASKLFGMVAHSDRTLAQKMVNAICRGLHCSRPQPSQFYSERVMVLIMLHRIRALGNIMAHLQLLNPDQLRLLYQNVVMMSDDLFVISCCNRTQIKQYEKFNFIYNGNRQSYDSVGYFALLPHVLDVWARLLPLVDQPHDYSCLLSLLCFTLTHAGPVENAATEVPLLNQVKALQTLLKVVPHVGCQEFLPLLLQLGTDLQPLVGEIFCRMAEQVCNQTPTLIACMNYYLENNPNCERLVILRLVGMGMVDVERVSYLVWQHLLVEEDYGTLVTLVQCMAKYDNSHDYTMFSLTYRLLLQPPNPQTIKLIAHVYSLTRHSQIIGLIDKYVAEHLTQFMHVARTIVTSTRQMDTQFLQLLLPSMATVSITAKTNPNNNTLIDIIRFVLLGYIVTTRSFTCTVRALLLFIEPALSAEVVGTAQQAIKHAVSITPLETINELATGRLEIVIKRMYQHIQSEEQARRLEEEEKARQLQNQQQAGTIKLKMFGVGR